VQPDTDATAVKISDELHASDSVIMAPEKNTCTSAEEHKHVRWANT
jgi:hypothetical protein